MKICPFCKAEIEDDSVFCFYCMNSLEEKQTLSIKSDKGKHIRWILIVILIFLLLITAGIFIRMATNKNNNKSDTEPTVSTTVDTTVDTSETTSSESTSPTRTTQPEHNSNSTSKPQGQNSTKPPAGETIPEQETDDTKAPIQNTPEPKPTDPPRPTPEQSGATYAYRQAKYGDDFYVHYPISDNDIVITKVLSPSADGRYTIPSTIDGKNVLAVSALAFSDPSICYTVEQVVVPSCVKTVWGDAFANCTNLTDVYLCGNSIYIETTAFVSPSQRNGNLTIHCSANCQDRNYRYYKSSAGYYGAQYSEWNGGGYN